MRTLVRIRFIAKIVGCIAKAMWQIGNAVPSRLAECIGFALIPYLANITLNKARKVTIPGKA